MAYKITQHRRGTYAEWLELNPVPYEGELIIVEFDDNIRKCKIGDGITYFSELPYITDWIEQDLTGKLEALEVLTEENLVTAISELYQKVLSDLANRDTSAEVLAAAVNNQLASLTADVDRLSGSLTKVDGVVKTLVDPAVGELDAKYSKELSRIVSQINADKKELANTVANTANDLTHLVTESVDQASKSLADQINLAKADLVTDYIDKQTKLESRIQNDIISIAQMSQESSRAISRIQEDFVRVRDSITEQIDEKIAASESKTGASIEEIIENIHSLNLALDQLQNNTYTAEVPMTYSLRANSVTNNDETVTELINQLEDLSFKVAALESSASINTSSIQSLSSEISRLNTSLTNLSTLQTKNYSQLTAAMSDVDTKLRKADIAIHEAIAEHTVSVNEELAKLSATDTLLYQIIYKIQDTLLKKIESSSEALQLELADDIARMSESLLTTKQALDSQLSQLRIDLSEGLVTVEDTITNKFERFKKLQDTKLDATTANLSALQSVVSANQSGVNTSLSTLRSTIMDNSADISKNTKEINRINSVLESDKALLNAELSSVATAIGTKTSEIENRLQPQINTVSSTLQSQAKILSEVQDIINDLLEDLDIRITDKVLASNDDTNKRIAELSAAVQQINLLLDQLETPSEDTGTSNIRSILDKINEDLVDLAADDIILYQIIHKVREEFLSLNNTTNNDVKKDLDNHKTAILQNLVNTKDELNEAIQQLNETLTDKISETATTASTSITAVYTTHNRQIADNQEAIADLTEAVLDNDAKTQEAITEVDDRVTEAIFGVNKELSGIHDETTVLSGTVDTLELSVDRLETAVKGLDGRIDNLLALQPGSSTLDGVLSDICVGYDGITHETAGGAVRAVGNDLLALDKEVKTLKNDLTPYLAAPAITKLHYDVKGETGLGQPYTLYLQSGDKIINESGVQIISAAGGGSGTGGGGSASTLSILYDDQQGDSFDAVVGSDINILFTFEGTDASGDSIRSATATWRVNGMVAEQGTVTRGKNTFPAKNAIYTALGDVENQTITIHLTVTHGISFVTKEWEVTLVKLTVDSNFPDKITYDPNSQILFHYIPNGEIEKTANFILYKLENGKYTKIKTFSEDLLSTDSGATKYINSFPTLDHGAYLLEVYLAAKYLVDENGKLLESESIFRNILCFDSADKDKPPVIGSAMKDLIVDQYSTTDIIFTVYSHESETPTIDIEVDDIPVKTGLVITANPNYNNTPTGKYSYVATTKGSHEIKIKCGSSELIISVEVAAMDTDITPVTTGLAFDFNPAGGSNNGTDIAWTNGSVNMTVSKNFDWDNGGYLSNDPDGPCFCIKAGSRATIDHKLFGPGILNFGKEFKLVFKTRRVANPEAVFLTCLDNTTNTDHIGIEMRAHEATIYGKNGKLDLAYSEEDVIEFDYNISSYVSTPGALNMVMGYEDGVPSRPMIFGENHKFEQNDPKYIILGSDDCDLYIYRMKAYNRSLDATDILKNFCADARTPSEMVERYERNKLFFNNKQWTPEELAEACRNLRIIKIEAPRFTKSKKDNVASIKGYNVKIQQIYKNGRPSDNWVAYDAVFSGQGTSSDNYGAAGRNLDLKVRIVEDDQGNPLNHDPHFITEENGSTRTDKVSLTDTSVPVDYFNIKVNIASSNNLTNALLAKRYNEFNPYNRPFAVRKDGTDTSFIKDTMEFYNCAVFIRESGPLADHQEFADTNWHFYAIGNIGDSKKTDNTRATDPENDSLECCVEIMDVGLPLSAFPKDTMVPGHFVDDEGNINITWSTQENLDLGILYEREYYVSNDSQLDLNKTYYIDSTNYIRVPTKELSGYNLADLYERVYQLTDDIEVVQNKKYYTDMGVRIKTEQLEDITNPHESGLYEWTGEHVKTSDTSFVLDKGYYELISEKKNAMEYTMETVDRYLFATDENLALKQLYECSFTEAVSPISKFKYYYININGTMQLAAGDDLNDNNITNLYECSATVSQDTLIDKTKTYYTRVEEYDGEDFLGAYYINAMGTTADTVRVYTYATPENLLAGNLYEVSYKLSEDTVLAATKDKTYFVDILENDDFSEDYTYGWRYRANKKNTEACKQAWIDFYRFVTTTTDDEFKTHLDKYFAVDSALYYYLFTDRYCMVDNRAKNTFWHYGKSRDAQGNTTYQEDIEIKNASGYVLFTANAGDPIRKWDLCWDYDNDTSLGLNNFGKQVYRYGLEDIDVDDAGEEIFRQSDSLFFRRIRELFADELRKMYQDLENAGAWSANDFIEEGDKWQRQFPEALWLADIERKYIRSFSKSFIDKEGDDQFLKTMSNGRMKYHRRQWERSQEQYMASKYQTTRALADAYHANFRVGRPQGESLAVQPNYQFTLTPYAYTYLNVQYGSAAPISVRAVPNQSTPIPYGGTSADIIKVGSASVISDFGNMSALYPRTAKMQNATRAKKLQFGNRLVSNYYNPIFESLTLGNNELLEELDLTNVAIAEDQNYKSLLNLKKLYAKGSRIPSISFAEGGKLDHVELPAVNSLVFKKLPYLATAEIDLDSYNNVVDLIIENCPEIEQLTLLERCTNVSTVRLDNIKFGTQEYSYFNNIVTVSDPETGKETKKETGLFRLKGYAADGRVTDNAQLYGTVHFTALTGDQFNEIRKRYPNLIITYDALTSVIKFMDTDTTTVLTPADQQIYVRDSEHKIDCTNITDTTVEEAKTSIVPSTVTEKPQSEEFSYTLFGWSTNKDEPAVNFEKLSGADAAAAEEAARKKYNETALTNIEGDRTFYPVFKATRRTYLVQFISDASGEDQVMFTCSMPYGDRVPEELYAKLIQKDTADYDAPGKYVFTGWVPIPEETVIRGETTFRAEFIEDKLTLVDIGEDNYSLATVKSVLGLVITGCDNKLNDMIEIPSTYTIANRAYSVISLGGFGSESVAAAYTALKLITLPETLLQLDDSAFQNCKELCEITIPSGVTTIPKTAFKGCDNLAKVILHDDVTTLDATCFADCKKLTEINLNEGLEFIKTYIFNKCALVNVAIPSSVKSIGNHAFGEMASLRSITIQSRALLSKSAFHYKAFEGSGTESEPLIITVPWSEEEHFKTFGGTTSKGVYYKVDVYENSVTGQIIYGDGKFGAKNAKVICTDTPKEEVIN